MAVLGVTMPLGLVLLVVATSLGAQVVTTPSVLIPFVLFSLCGCGRPKLMHCTSG
jgi:hypothetical protein